MLYGKITLTPLKDTGERSRTVNPEPNLANHKPRWVPVVEIVNDTSTGDQKKDLGWSTNVFNDRIERVRTIRDKTAGEMAAEDNSAVDGMFERVGNDKALVNLIRDLDNRVRVLEGSQPLPLEAFKGLVKTKRRN